MAQESAYNLDNEGLLKIFMNACARAGVSRSGLVIDPPAGYELAEAHYLKGVVLARMEGKRPPFKAGDEIISESGVREGYSTLAIPPKQKLRVRCVYYKGSNNWSVEFPGLSGGSYPAEKFVLAPPENSTEKKS